MPMINGRFYINPAYGQAVGNNRIMDAFGNGQPSGGDDQDDDIQAAAGNFLPNLLNLLIGMLTRPVSVPDYLRQQQAPPSPQPSQNPYSGSPYLPLLLGSSSDQYGQYQNPSPALLAASTDQASSQPDPSQSAAPQAPNIQSPAPQLNPQAGTSDSNNPFGNFGGALQNPPAAPSPAPGRSLRGAMSYSEATDGTVAEHEAMQSTVINRVGSGQQYWVDKGQDLNEDNVVTAKKPPQYLGVGSDRYTQYLDGTATTPGAGNAMQADQLITRNGPITDATSFVVHQDGSPPSDREIMNMGHVVPANPPKVGRVYLYKPAPGQ